jgi:hypothetical protein
MKYKEREFVTWVEIPVRVYFDYQPEEKEERHYPGCPASIEINDVDFEQRPILPIFGPTNWDNIRDYIMEKYGEDLAKEAWEHLD